jgi:L-threonylcarbamoyladenylate synthase
MPPSTSISRWHLREAVRTVDAGGIIAYPTEAVYGLGCDPLDRAAVLRLLRLKQRPASKGLILIAASVEQLQPYLGPLAPAMSRRIRATWPGPVTWVVPARPETPWWLRGAHAGIAVRVTGHPLAAALCGAAGRALVSTSANVASRPPARTALRVRLVFGDEIDCILHGPTGALDRPTEIRNATSGVILRAG